MDDVAASKKSTISSGTVVFFVVALIAGAVVFFLFLSNWNRSGKDNGTSSRSSPGPSSPAGPWKYARDTMRGMVSSTPEHSSSKDNPQDCANWCQAQPKAAYFNYNSGGSSASVDGNNCYCVTTDQIDNLDQGPKSMCIFNAQGWASGPVETQPSTPCPEWLINLSSCHTAQEIEGWPNAQSAEAITPKGSFHDSTSCVNACEQASKDVQAALFVHDELAQPSAACGCYRKWDSDTACFDPNGIFENKDVTLDLWTRDKVTQCPPNFEGCSPVGHCTCTCNPSSPFDCGWFGTQHTCAEGKTPTCSKKYCDTTDPTPCTCACL